MSPIPREFDEVGKAKDMPTSVSRMIDINLDSARTVMTGLWDLKKKAAERGSQDNLCVAAVLHGDGFASDLVITAHAFPPKHESWEQAKKFLFETEMLKDMATRWPNITDMDRAMLSVTIRDIVEIGDNTSEGPKPTLLASAIQLMALSTDVFRENWELPSHSRDASFICGIRYTESRQGYYGVMIATGYITMFAANKTAN